VPEASHEQWKARRVGESLRKIGVAVHSVLSYQLDTNKSDLWRSQGQKSPGEQPTDSDFKYPVTYHGRPCQPRDEALSIICELASGIWMPTPFIISLKRGCAAERLVSIACIAKGDVGEDVHPSRRF
jgi:hypothetical protein